MQNHAGWCGIPLFLCLRFSFQWQLVLDEQPLDSRNDSCPAPVYDPEAILALIYTSGTTGRPKGVMVSHANILANLDHFSYWMGYRECGVYLHAAPIFHIADFPPCSRQPAFVRAKSRFQSSPRKGFCELVQRERATHTVLVPTMLNLLTQMPEAKPYDLSSPRGSGLWRLSNGAGTCPSGEKASAERETSPMLWDSARPVFLTGLQDQEHVGSKLLSCGLALSRN